MFSTYGYTQAGKFQDGLKKLHSSIEAHGRIPEKNPNCNQDLIEYIEYYVLAFSSFCYNADEETSSLQCDRSLIRRKDYILKQKLTFSHFLFNTLNDTRSHSCLLTQSCFNIFQSNLPGSMKQSMIPSLPPLCPYPDLAFSPQLIITHPFYWLILFSSLAKALFTKGTSGQWSHFAETPIAQCQKMHKYTQIHTLTESRGIPVMTLQPPYPHTASLSLTTQTDSGGS